MEVAPNLEAVVEASEEEEGVILRAPLTKVPGQDDGLLAFSPAQSALSRRGIVKLPGVTRVPQGVVAIGEEKVCGVAGGISRQGAHGAVLGQSSSVEIEASRRGMAGRFPAREVPPLFETARLGTGSWRK